MTAREPVHPETGFAMTPRGRVAYRMSGAGPRDVVMSPGFWSHMELIREDPGHVRFRKRMQSFSRYVGFDSLGTGLSDRRESGSATEAWIESCAAVLDAVCSPAPVIVSVYGTGPLVLQFVSRYPHRCSGLIFINTYACWAARADYPIGASPGEIARTRELMRNSWGREGFPVPSAPSQSNNADFLRWSASLQRAMATPEAVLEGLSEMQQLDMRHVLAQIRVPTLVMARTGLAPAAFARTRYIAEQVANAQFVELPGADVAPFYEAPDAILGNIETFIEGLVPGVSEEE